MFFTVLLAGIFIGASLVQAAYEEFLFIEGSLCREVDDIAELPRILDQACHTGKLTGKEVVTEMPEELIWQYTRCGTIPVKDYLVDDTFGGQGSHYKYSRNDVKAIEDKWHRMFFEDPDALHALPPNEYNRVWALQDQRDTFKKKTVMVFGSTSPDVETLLLLLGAKDVITVDYNQLTFEDRRLKTMTLEELKSQIEAGTAPRVDAAVSFSSFDHDGLGRYGDPLCPDGDLMAMDIVKRVLSSDGTLFLSVPLGADAVAWNLMRRYGVLRLPLLLDGWETTKQYGGDAEKSVEATMEITKTHEPVLLLKAKKPPMHEDL